MAPRTCICGRQLEWSQDYGPVSQNLFKWYPDGKSFGTPGTRRKFYLCREHTMEVTEYLEALHEGVPVAVIKEEA